MSDQPREQPANKPRKRLSRRAKILLWSGSIVALPVIGLTFLSLTASPISHWRSPEGKQEYEAAYKAAMQRLPPVSQVYDVKTDFGTVRRTDLRR